jgi:phosphatidylinositol glycan class M
MVANISTRGSSEGLLAVLVVALLWATLSKRILLAGTLLGFGVHLKIYPFIYAASIFWWLESPTRPNRALRGEQVLALINRDRIKLATSSFVAFMACNVAMYQL